MKILILLSMFILVSCNGSGGSSSGESENKTQSDLIVRFESYNFFVNTGWTSEQYTVDEQRSIVIPEKIALLQDSNSSVQMNDIARIKFVDSNCDYLWDGTNFSFSSCNGALSGAQFGDVIYLYDLTSFGNPAMAGLINIGVYRNPAANHTGNIIIRANLQ